MSAIKNIDSPERGVLLLDSNLRIMSANQRAAELFKQPVSGLIGQFLPKPVKNIADTPEQVLEEVLENAFGSDRILHRYSAPILAADGAPAGRVEIYSDITARRELEKEILDRNIELAELNKQLEEAQEQLIQSERLRALGEMAAGVAHDINNVLGIILGNVQLAKRKIDSKSPAVTCINAIEMAARDAANTVHRLREIGKPIDTSGYRMIDLRNIAEDVIEALMPALSEAESGNGAEISIETSLEPQCTILGNPTELREALANILLNAAQSIESNGVIEVTTRRDNGFAELLVRDTGMGMDEETRKRLFDPFFTTRGAEGTGLGMSMVDAIAIRHRGKVYVESRETKGSIIRLRFPLAIGQNI